MDGFIETLFQEISKQGLVAIFFALFGVTLWKRILVMGWVVEELLQRIKVKDAIIEKQDATNARQSSLIIKQAATIDRQSAVIERLRGG